MKFCDIDEVERYLTGLPEGATAGYALADAGSHRWTPFWSKENVLAQTMYVMTGTPHFVHYDRYYALGSHEHPLPLPTWASCYLTIIDAGAAGKENAVVVTREQALAFLTALANILASNGLRDEEEDEE